MNRIRLGIVAVLTAVAVLGGAPMAAHAATTTVSGVVSFGTAGNHPAGFTAVVSYRPAGGGSWITGPTTNAAGNWSLDLPPGGYTFRFTPNQATVQTIYWQDKTGPDSATVVSVAGTPITDISPVLPALGSITGRVFLGTSAQPAALNQVKVDRSVCYDDGCVSGPPAYVYTDASGYYTIPNLPNGRYTLTYSLNGGTGYWPTTSTVVVSTAQPAQSGKNATLPVPGSISGRVTLGDASTPPPPNSTVVSAWGTLNSSSDYGFRGSVIVDANGYYTLGDLAPGTNSYHLFFNYTTSGAWASEWYGDSYVQLASTRVVSTSAGTTGIDATLVRGATLSGRVTNTSGQAIPVGGKVFARAYYGTTQTYGDMYSTWSEVFLASDGTYSITGLPPGANYTVRFWPGPATTYLEASRSTSLVAGQVRSGFDQVLRSPVFAQAGLHCATCAVSTQVRLKLQQKNGGFWTTVAGSEVVGLTESSVSFGMLYDGAYRVALNQGGFDPQWGPEWTVVEGSPLTVPQIDLTPRPLVVRDMSADGVPDVLGRNGAGLLYRWTGAGDGTFDPQLDNLGSGWNTMNLLLHAGDADGDVYNDVFARDTSGRLWLFPGRPDGRWGAAVQVGTGWNGFTAVISPGDFDGDGDPDVLGRAGDGRLYLYRGNGTGGFEGYQIIGSGWNGFTALVAPGDFDGDGTVDMMGRDSIGRLYLYRGDGAGGFGGYEIIGSGWNGFNAIIGAGDFDGDGNGDVFGRDGIGRLWLYRGDGAGAWQGGAPISSGWGTVTFVG